MGKRFIVMIMIVAVALGAVVGIVLFQLQKPTQQEAAVEEREAVEKEEAPAEEEAPDEFSDNLDAAFEELDALEGL